MLKRLDLDKLKYAANGLNSFKSKLGKLGADEFVAPVNLSKLTDVVKSDVVKKDAYKLRSKILKIKCLILLS